MNRSALAPYHRTPLYRYIAAHPEQRARAADGRPLAVLPAYLIARAGLDRLAVPWVRPPETWVAPHTGDVRVLLRDFVQHTLVRYADVPEFLYRAFLHAHPRDERAASWFIGLAGGASVRNLPDWPAHFTRAMAHQFRQAPAWMTVQQALYFAVARGLGASLRLAKTLARALPAAPAEPLTWWTAALTLLLRTPDLDVKAVSSLVTYWGSVFATLDADRGPNTLPDLDPYWPPRGPERHRGAAKAASVRPQHVALEPMRLPDVRTTWMPRILRRFRVRQIRWSDALTGEGRRMQHCVGGYIDYCREGRAFIFQLVPDIGENDVATRLTLEVNAYRDLVQVKGYKNRLPTPFERELVRAWARWAGVNAAGDWET